MDSSSIKAGLLAYFRFKRQYRYVATECGYYSADVLASNGRKLIEVEVKVSKSDLKRDINKPKHKVYADPNDRKIWIPHEFYVAVPQHLTEFAIEEVSKWNPKYGVISFKEDGLLEERFTVTKRGGMLHKQIIKDGVKAGFIARMSSELASIWMFNTRYNRMAADVRDILASIKDSPDPFK